MSEPVEAKPAWILGWEAGASSVTAILTDLIAELRATHKQGKRCVMDCCTSCTRCDRNDSWPCAEIKAANRAEARLKGLNDE